MLRFLAPITLALGLVSLCLVFSGCSFDDTVKPCAAAASCATGQSCYRGFCIPARNSGSEQAPPIDASLAPASADAALSESRTSMASSSCEPSEESCNGTDDDCDGNTDEDTTIDCYPEATEGCSAGSCTGACSYGKEVCSNGERAACSGAQGPQAEHCSEGSQMAEDEDCDGRVDEGCACSGGATRSCYMGPTKTVGVGACKAGTQTCKTGQFGACEHSVVPSAESCDNEGSDDDCNGVKDDIRDRNGACSVADGAAGSCGMGTWQCVSGGPKLQCVASKPAAEQCNGKDDDCNGKVDDGFDLQTDRLHCGRCGNACRSGELCCAGVCAAPNDAGTCNAPGTCPKCAADEECCDGRCVNTHGTDINHCGGCNTACKTGAQPACCGGLCADLTADTTCGRCDNACGLLSLGGLACKCGSLNNELQCVGLDVSGLLQLCL